MVRLKLYNFEWDAIKDAAEKMPANERSSPLKRALNHIDRFLVDEKKRNDYHGPWNWSVSIQFAGLDDFFEDAITDTAKLYNGYVGGSGSNISSGDRDVDFVFTEESDAKEFAERIQLRYKAKVELRESSHKT